MALVYGIFICIVTSLASLEMLLFLDDEYSKKKKNGSSDEVLRDLYDDMYVLGCEKILITSSYECLRKGIILRVFVCDVYTS